MRVGFQLISRCSRARRSNLVSNRAVRCRVLSANYHTTSITSAKKSADPIKKKIKMSDKEFYSKASLLLAEDRLEDYELPPLRFTPNAVINDETGEVLVDLAETGTDLRNLHNNNHFRKVLAQKINTISSCWAIFPDVLNEFMPRVNLVVEYEDEQLAYWGNEIDIKYLAKKPKVSFPMPEIGSTRHWTLVLIGQEVDKSHLQHLHYLVGNIPSNNIEQGEELVPFTPTIPADYTGLHKYLWVLASQEGKVDFTRWTPPHSTPEERGQFIMRKLLGKHSLTPKGLCFFHAKWHPSIPDSSSLLECYPKMSPEQLAQQMEQVEQFIK